MEELQKSLSLKSQELEAKNALANQKLKQMVSSLWKKKKWAQLFFIINGIFSYWKFFLTFRHENKQQIILWPNEGRWFF